ncbi:MAG: hypothetical protein ACXWT3_09785 [Methylococcaceae bacterium]
MQKNLVMATFSLIMLISQNSLAEPFTLPVQLDYTLIKKALITQLYTGSGNSAELWHDKHGCSYLKMSDPRISGQSGQIKMLNNVQTQFGTHFGGQCVTVLQWAGVLETLQQPTLNNDHSILSLPVTKAIAYDQQGRQLAIDKLQDLLTRYAEPRLAELKFDLNKSRGDIEQTIAKYLPEDNMPELKTALDTLKFSSAAANDNGVAIDLKFDAPGKIPGKKPAAALTAAEQQQWQAAWQEWDAFLGKAIKQATDDAQSQELRDTLTEILLDARSSFQAGLKEHDATGPDPVRVFFTDTWERLGPVLRTLAKELPEIQGLRYMTFIAATDVIYELENRGAPFGLEISSDGLRRLARILLAAKEEKAAGQL